MGVRSCLLACWAAQGNAQSGKAHAFGDVLRGAPESGIKVAMDAPKFCFHMSSPPATEAATLLQHQLSQQVHPNQVATPLCTRP